MIARGSIEDAQRFMQLLSRPGDVFELRGLMKGRSVPQVTAGYFNDMAKLAAAAIDRSGKDDGVYVTLNPVNPALLARAPANRVRQAGNGDTTSDRDVQRRRHLLVDVDPVRPAGISSTNEEHAGALELAATISSALTCLGWPEPILADSGNGGHLIYSIDLPVDDGGLVKRVLARLSQLHTTSTLKVDEKVFNPARISKMYGTLTRKGEDTEDRPHRMARILRAPERLVEVTREQLEALAPVAATSKATAPDRPREYTGPKFDLDGWLAEHLPDAVAQPWSEGRKWLLPVCPFNSDHNRREAYVTEKHGGMIAAGCQHESCFKSWRELRLRFEPDAYERSTAPDRTLAELGPSPEVLYQAPGYDPDIDPFADRDRDPPVVRQAKEAAPIPTFTLLSIDDALDDIELLSNADILPTPFDTLNSGLGLGGFLGTQVYTVCASTGRGKTTWAATMAAHAAQCGIPVLISVHELSPGYFVARRAAGLLGVHSNDILRGKISREQIHEVMPHPTMKFLKRPSLEGLRDAADFMAQKFGKAPLLIVDYLQKFADEIASKQQRPDLRLATTEASDALVGIGERVGCSVCAISSIGRNKAQLKTPRKFHPFELVEVAKESGAVEYDGAALIVLTLSNDFDGDKRIGTMTLAKSRFGRELHIDARYQGAAGVWEDVGEVDVVEKIKTPPAPEEGRADHVRRAIIAELRKGPVMNKTTLVKRIKGCRRESVIEVYAALWVEGVIGKLGPGVGLTDKGQQLVIEVAK